MWQSILFSNNDLIFLRSLDSERRKRQHLKNQVQWYVRRESKHLSVPTTCEVECSSQCSVSYIMPSLTKQAFRKDDSVELKPTTLAHSTAKEKPLRYLRGNALGIEAFRSRHQARLTIARRRCRNAQKIIYMYQLVASYFRYTPHCQGL